MGKLKKTAFKETESNMNLRNIFPKKEKVMLKKISRLKA